MPGGRQVWPGDLGVGSLECLRRDGRYQGSRPDSHSSSRTSNQCGSLVCASSLSSRRSGRRWHPNRNCRADWRHSGDKAAGVSGGGPGHVPTVPPDQEGELAHVQELRGLSKSCDGLRRTPSDSRSPGPTSPRWWWSAV